MITLTAEQQKILDKLANDWVRTQQIAAQTLAQANQAQTNNVVAESKLKGVIEAFGGRDFRWDGQHITISKDGFPDEPVVELEQSKNGLRLVRKPVKR